MLLVDGVSRSMSEWGRVTGLGKDVIHQRLRRGWSVVDAVKKPLTLARDEVDRFTEKIHFDIECGCWLWTGATTTRFKTGYAAFSCGGRDIGGHVWAYLFFNGPIQKGKFIDHLCQETTCVNPRHLEEVTPRENTLRGVGPSAVNARKTMCPKRHSYASQKFGAIKGRRCLECFRATRRKANAKYASDPLNRNKILAGKALKRALSSKRVARPLTCNSCGRIPPVRRDGRSGLDAHHFRGYEREHWLHVVWLCSSCHHQDKRSAS